MNSVLNSEFTIHYFPTNRLTPAPATLYARCPNPARKLWKTGKKRNNDLTLPFIYCMVCRMVEKRKRHERGIEEVSFKPLTVMRGSLENRRREEHMYVYKYENYLDNRCAALVWRGPRAPRAKQECKPCMGNELRLMSLLSMARGAQVSRACPERCRMGEPERAAQAHAANRHRTRLRDFKLYCVAGATPHSRGQRLET